MFWHLLLTTHRQNKGEDPKWNIDLVKPVNDTLYIFNGSQTADVVSTQQLAFNLSQFCSTPSSPSFAEDALNPYLFLGATERPDPGSKPEVWTGGSVPIPVIEGEFNDRFSDWSMQSLFTMTNSPRNTELVGAIEVSFRGDIDANRSDQLYLGREIPEWNATVGFYITTFLDKKSMAMRNICMVQVLRHIVGVIVILLIFL